MFLIKRLKDGDPKALEKIYKLFFSRIYRLCNKYVKNEETASDLVQDAFLKFWSNRKNISVELPLDQQLFVVTKNVVFDYFRKKATEEKMLLQYSGNIENNTSEEVHDKDLKLQKIISIIKSLPEKQRQVIELAKFEGLTYEEIGKEMNISRHTVSTHFSAAMKSLRKHLHILLFWMSPYFYLH